MSGPDGLAVIDKEAGWTSHDVVAKARGVFGTRRVGHAGTLDPDATGVLLLGVGRATRLLRFLTPLPKHYTGELVLGVSTTTLDASGEVTAVFDMSGVTPEEVAEAAAGFVGPIMQVPPMVSAVKVGGRRLHELAREGLEVEREARPVVVQELTVTPVGSGSQHSEAPAKPGEAAKPSEAVYRMEVRCSSGTYVRSLAADIGSALGGGGHLRALRRLSIGSFTVAQAQPVTAPKLLSMAEALRDYSPVSVDGDLARRVGHGQVLPAGELAATELAATGEGPWPVLGPEGQLLAVYEAHTAGSVKPVVVIPW